jgi:hypothetical protein
MRLAIVLLVAAACSSGSSGPARAPAGPTAQPPARPSVVECKAALDHLIEVALIAVFEDDEEMRTEAMAQVRADQPGDLEHRCSAQATPEQVRCLAAAADVEAVQRCAASMHRCSQGDEQACATAEREWGWAAELLTNIFEL